MFMVQGVWVGVGGLGVRGGLVFKAHRLVHHSTPGSQVTKKKKKKVGGLTRIEVARL